MLDTPLWSRGSSSTLAILLHAYRMSPDSLEQVRDAVAECLPDADIAVPKLPIGWFSNARPSHLAVQIADLISEFYKRRKYDRIILIGHSLGALLARKAYVIARGQTQDVETLAAEPRPWAGAVERIILLAAMNRGWSLRKPYPRGLTFWRRLLIRLGMWTLWPLRIGQTIKKVRRGSPFIGNLRIQWLNLVRSGSPPAPTIQLLGDGDDVVSPEDTIDLDVGRNFTYLRVPEASHTNVISFKGSAGAARKGVFVHAVITPVSQLRSDYDVRRNTVAPDDSVNEVVFVMHGIRDRGYWTRDVGNHIIGYANARGHKLRASTSDYGYFAMLPFLILRARQKNVRWFMDQYTEAMARYPRARFSFVGHSNGTYLLGGALRRYAAATFHRAVLLGSVLPTKYQWDKFISNKRIASIRNYVATRDVIVGIFPGAFELVKSQELGSAGHDGFAEYEVAQLQMQFVVGGHAAALDRRNWDSIAAFIVDGRAISPPSALCAKQRDAAVVLASKLCWLVWLLLLGTLIAIGVGILALGGLGYLLAYLVLLICVLLTI